MRADGRRRQQVEIVTLAVTAGVAAIGGVVLARVAMERITSSMRASVVRTRREATISRRG